MTANYVGGVLNSLGMFMHSKENIPSNLVSVFGFISDIYGRRNAFSIANVLYIVIRFVFYLRWKGLHDQCLIGLSLTSSKSTTNSSLASSSLAIVFSPSECEWGDDCLSDHSLLTWLSAAVTLCSPRFVTRGAANITTLWAEWSGWPGSWQHRG